MIPGLGKEKVIITGGGGFVGRVLCYELADAGAEVISVSRGSYPELEAYSPNITAISADVNDSFEQYLDLMQGSTAIIHTAAYVRMWGAYQDFYRTNVNGTKNMLRLAEKLSIPKFIYTSSPSVITDGKNLRGINETYSYPKSYLASYPQTKAEAEQIVLAANSDALRTLALRPHLIWGPGDTHFVPTIVERARQNKLVQVGDGENLVDLCFISDCVRAHLCALQALDTNARAAGKPYFISQGEPVKLWSWISEVLERHNLPAPARKIAALPAYALATALEFAFKYVPGISAEPPLTRFLVKEMSTDHYFDLSRARQELGFVPQYSIDEAMELTFN